MRGPGTEAEDRRSGLRSLDRESLWSLAGHVVFAACKWAAVLVLARLATPVEVGRYALGFAIGAPIVMFANLRLAEVLATDASGSFALDHYLALRLRSALLALLAIALVSVSGLYAGAAALTIFAVGVGKCVESVGDITHGLFLREERMRTVAVSMLLKGLLGLSALTVATWQTGSAASAALAMAGAWLLVVLGYDLPRWAALRGVVEVDPEPREGGTLGALLRLCIPLGVVAFLGSFAANLSRFFVEAELGEYELGVFAAMAWFGAGGWLVASALGQPLLPGLARAYADNDHAELRRLANRLIAVVASVAVLGIGFAATVGDDVLGWIYGDAFAVPKHVFALVMAAAGVGYFVLAQGFLFTALRQLHVQALLMALTIIVLAVGCVVLVPVWGLAGAAVAEGVAMAVHLVLGVVALQRMRGRLPPSPTAAGANAGPARVLVVTRALGVGGAETHLMSVLPRLDPARCQVTVFALQGDPGREQELRAAGVAVRVGTRLRGRAPRLLLSVVRLLRLLYGERPDVVHFFLPEAYLVGGLVCLLSPVPVRVMSRRSLNRYQHRYPMLRTVERWLHGRMNYVLGNSRAVVAELREEGVDARRLGILYSGVDTDRFVGLDRAAARAELDIGDRTLVFVIVANLIGYKGHADLLHALQRVSAQLPGDWLLLCVGRDDGEGAGLETLASELGLSSRVRWLGERRDVPRLLVAGDIGVLCSHEEGFSNSVLEGMAAGLPMLVTDVGGNAEAVADGECGVLVPARDPAALGDGLLRLARDASLRRTLAAAATARVQQQFTLAATVHAYEEFYTDACRRQRLSPRLAALTMDVTA